MTVLKANSTYLTPCGVCSSPLELLYSSCCSNKTIKSVHSPSEMSRLLLRTQIQSKPPASHKQTSVPPRGSSNLWQPHSLNMLSCKRLQHLFLSPHRWFNRDSVFVIMQLLAAAALTYGFVFLFLHRMGIHRTHTAAGSRGWWRPITRVSNLCDCMDPPTSPLSLTMWPGRSTIIMARDAEADAQSTVLPRNSWCDQLALVTFSRVWAALQPSVRQREEIKRNVRTALSPETNTMRQRWAFRCMKLKVAHSRRRVLWMLRLPPCKHSVNWPPQTEEENVLYIKASLLKRDMQAQKCGEICIRATNYKCKSSPLLFLNI